MIMANHSTYPYQPLLNNHISKSLRFIKLLPGLPGTDLQCTIIHEQFSSVDPHPIFEDSYEALSYTWGSTNEYPCQITSNNIRIPVKQNLFDALYQLRKLDASRLLWVDALCINQVDDKEKEVMIPMMKYIYKYASSVLIWLGTEDEFTAGALAIIDCAAKLLREETGKHVPFDFQVVRESNSAQKTRREVFLLLMMWSHGNRFLISGRDSGSLARGSFRSLLWLHLPQLFSGLWREIGRTLAWQQCSSHSRRTAGQSTECQRLWISCMGCGVLHAWQARIWSFNHGHYFFCCG
jgi:hypothetical protein